MVMLQLFVCVYCEEILTLGWLGLGYLFPARTTIQNLFTCYISLDLPETTNFIVHFLFHVVLTCPTLSTCYSLCLHRYPCWSFYMVPTCLVVWWFLMSAWYPSGLKHDWPHLRTTKPTLWLHEAAPPLGGSLLFWGCYRVDTWTWRCVAKTSH